MRSMLGSSRHLSCFAVRRLEPRALQRLIENEDVLVNSKPAKPSYKLRENDEIEVELIAPPADVFAPENIPIEIV